MLTLNDRKIAILGGTTGIGLATARLLIERGAKVIIGGRDEGRLSDALDSLSNGARAIRVDATDRDSLQSFFQEAGQIDDLVVTVTSRGGAGPATELSDQDLTAAFEGKPIAHLQAVCEALPTLGDHGSLTLVSAGSAQSALPGTALLAAVNGAIEAAVPPLARELAPRRVNAISPGVVETGWWDELPEEERNAVFEQFSEQTPVGRIGDPDDVAHAICELIENDFINGVVLPCDGGLRLT